MHCTKSQALVIQTMINVNSSCKIFPHKGGQVWKPTSLRARAEIDASTARRDLGEKGQNANLHKKDVRRPILTTFGTRSLICLPVLPTLHRTHLHTLSCLLLLKTPQGTKRSKKTYCRPGWSCLNWTTVIVKTHFSMFFALSVAW